MKVYGKAGVGDVFGEKPLKDKIQIAQGERSRRMQRENEDHVFLCCLEGMTFHQLRLETGLCRQSLNKHLKHFESKNRIFRDTIKSWDKRNTVAIDHSKVPKKPYTFSDVGRIAKHQQRIGSIVFKARLYNHNGFLWFCRSGQAKIILWHRRSLLS